MWPTDSPLSSSYIVIHWCLSHVSYRSIHVIHSSADRQEVVYAPYRWHHRPKTMPIIDSSTSVSYYCAITDYYLSVFLPVSHDFRTAKNISEDSEVVSVARWRRGPNSTSPAYSLTLVSYLMSHSNFLVYFWPFPIQSHSWFSRFWIHTGSGLRR
jgi:hypothetical protein